MTETSEKPSSKSTSLKDFWFVFSFVLLALIVLVFVIYQIGIYKKLDFKTHTDLVTYVALVLGTAVTFSASYVVILLGKRSVKSAEVMESLTADYNRIALAMLPTSVAAVSAADQYSRLKSLLITMPSILRKAMRDGLTFDESLLTNSEVPVVDDSQDSYLAEDQEPQEQEDLDFGLPDEDLAPEPDKTNYLSDVWSSLQGPVNAVLHDVLESNTTGFIIALANHAERYVENAQTKVKSEAPMDQRYFEFAFSSLYYELNLLASQVNSASKGKANIQLIEQFMRLLHGVYSTVGNTDKLVEFCLLMKNDTTTPNLAFSDQELKFLEHIAPATNLNKSIWLGSDFENVANRIKAKILKNSPVSFAGSWEKYISAKTDASHSKFGTVYSLHETGSSEVVHQIRCNLAKKDVDSIVVHVEGMWQKEIRSDLKNCTIIFLVSSSPELKLAEISSFLLNKPDLGLKNYILIDQVDANLGSWNPKSSLSLAEHIGLWKACNFVSSVSAVFKKHKGASDPANRLHSRFKEEIQQLAFNLSILPTETKGYIRSAFKKLDATVAVFGHVAIKLDPAFLNSEDNVMFDLYVSAMQGVVDDAMNNPGSFVTSLCDGSRHFKRMSMDPEIEPIVIVAEKVVNALGETPLSNRPLYLFNAFPISIPDSGIDVFIPNSSIIGITYINSECKVGRSPLSELLADNPYCISLF